MADFIVHSAPEDKNGAILSDFIPPQSGQHVGTEPTTDLDPLDDIQDSFFDIDGPIFRDKGELLIDDAGPNYKTSRTKSGLVDSKLASNWQPTDSLDETLINDAVFDENISEWSEEIFHSDWIMSYEDDPTLVVAVPDTKIRLDNPSSSGTVTHASVKVNATGPEPSKEANPSRDRFDDSYLADGLIDLRTPSPGTAVQKQLPHSPTQRISPPKLQWMSPKTFTPAKSSKVRCGREVLHQVPVNKDGEALPFLRPPFPKPIRDRSPILGLTNRMILRTCFRVGEALNAGAAAIRTNTDAVIELYARIVHSEREVNKGYKQSLQFGDLFTDKPPYLGATYSLWKGVPLWDHDSRAFVGNGGKGKMCRAVGRIKRSEQGKGCEMVVLSIWEVDWEDVGVAKGVVCS